MTIWLFFAFYSFAGIGFLFVTLVGKFIVAFGRPATSDGHLDVQIEMGSLSRWYFLSAIVIAPVVIAYAGESRSYRSDALERSNVMLTLYMFIAMVWIIKLQIQMNRLKDRET